MREAEERILIQNVGFENEADAAPWLEHFTFADLRDHPHVIRTFIRHGVPPIYAGSLYALARREPTVAWWRDIIAAYEDGIPLGYAILAFERTG